MKDRLLTSSPRVIHILMFSCEMIFSYVPCNLSLWAFANVFFLQSVSSFTISSMPFSFCFSVSLLVSVSLSGEGGTGTKAAAGGGEEEARGGGEEAAGRDCASAEISR